MRRLGVLIAFVLIGFSYGIAAGHYHLFPYEEIRGIGRTLFRSRNDPVSPGPAGRWYKSRLSSPSASPRDRTIERLESLGYLGGYSPASREAGVITYDAGRVQDGLTLFSSGHAPAVHLISATGEMMHTWEVAFEDIWPHDLPFATSEEHKQFIRRAYVFPTGDLLAIFEYIGIVRLDKDSNVLWKSPGRNHHDLAVKVDGSIVTLAQREVSAAEVERRFPGLESPRGFLDDQLVFLSGSGEELKSISIFEALYRSEYAPFLNVDGIEPLHANSVDVIENVTDEERSALTNGEILVSLRTPSAIVSIDPEASTATWMLSGKWRAQHQAQLLDSGNILLLDNLGGNSEAPFKRGMSQVLEVNPWTQQIAWRYSGSRDSRFFTHWLGYVQRLPNGNTLITESTQGRILEVTKRGRVVWEYLSPHRAGENGELIATVMGARRVRAEDLPFLQR